MNLIGLLAHRQHRLIILVTVFLSCRAGHHLTLPERPAAVKLEPVPLFAFRDSAVTFWHHHLIIEGQRKNKKGLIAGIKKDVVSFAKMTSDRVAIYGWHKLDGKPIQPLYTGHVNWYVDYSHGIRLVYKKINVNGRWMNYDEVLQHPVYKKLLSDYE